MNVTIPFAEHVGLQVRERPDGNIVVVLPETDKTLNHIGTQHAGALFTLAETASGLYLQRIFARHVSSATVIPVVRGASIAFKKPARGAVSATASMDLSPGQVLDAIQSQGRADFAVHVTLVNSQEEVIATCEVGWHFRA